MAIYRIFFVAGFDTLWGAGCLTTILISICNVTLIIDLQGHDNILCPLDDYVGQS